MKPEQSLPARLLIAASAVAVLTVGCQNSNSMTGPSTGTASSAARIAGSWSGTFQAYDSHCGGSSASASFQQDGTAVTGLLTTSACGVGGYFKGTIQGSMLVGSVEMAGCTGGGVSGTVSESQISLSIGDLTKPLVTGDRPVMAGGAVSLRR